MLEICYALTFLAYNTGILRGVVDDGNGNVIAPAAVIGDRTFERYLVAVSFTVCQQAPVFGDNYRR